MRDLSDDPAFRPLSARNLAARSMFSSGGRQMTEAQARMASRLTTRQGPRKPQAAPGKGSVARK